MVKCARRLGGCTQCFSLNHSCFNCNSALRCAAYFKFGHKFKFCLTKSWPRVCWQPKNRQQFEKPSLENEESMRNSALPLNPSAVVQSHTEGASSHSGSLAAEPILLHTSSPASPILPEGDHLREDMANFAVDLAPFIPEGLEIEDWAWPLCGRIIVSGNPPRLHEEYAIVIVLPPPQQNHLYEAMDKVVDYFEEEHRVRVLSSCLSPLGLCLIQFHSPVARQAMVNLSPHQLDAMHEIVVKEHDRGINMRNCPFTRTCWIMFLAFPLDFHTRDIISQAVGHFGTVITQTRNTRCKSRLLLRCKVTLVSRIPRSLLVCEGNLLVIMVLLGQFQFLCSAANTLMSLQQMKIRYPQMATLIW